MPTKRKCSEVALSTDDHVQIGYGVPKTKRFCAGLNGAVVAKTQQTVTVKLEVQDMAPLFACLDAAGHITVSLKHITEPRTTAACSAMPFCFDGIQGKLVELLDWKDLLRLYGAGLGVLTLDSLRDGLCEGMRRTLCGWRERAAVRELATMQSEWRAWEKGVFLKRIAYGPLRDVLVRSFTLDWSTGVETIPWTAYAFLQYIAVPYDEKAIEMLLEYKARHRHTEDHRSHLGLCISHFCGAGVRRPPDYAILGLVRLFARWGRWIAWRDLERLLGHVHGARVRLAGSLRKLCHTEALTFLLQCVGKVNIFAHQTEACRMIGEVMQALTCNEISVYRNLVRILAESSGPAVVELHSNRWLAEPEVLGADIARCLNLFICSADVQTFACIVGLVHAVPIPSLWCIVRSIMAAPRLNQTIKYCGYPKATTDFFSQVILVMIRRDPSLEPYISATFATYDGQAGIWLSSALDSQGGVPTGHTK